MPNPAHKLEKDDYSTVDEMRTVYERKINLLKEAAEYRTANKVQLGLDTLNEAKDKLHEIFKEIRSEIVKGEEALNDMQVLLHEVETINHRLDHMKENFPAVLKKSSTEPEKVSKPAVKTSKGENCQTTISLMQYVTVQEFDSVPKYMRGRYKYEQINKLVDDFNSSLQTKYIFLSRPRKTMKPNELKKWSKIKSQDNADTKGVFFLTPDDLKDFGNLRLDQSNRNILTIIRHCGKVKEVRGPGALLRYAVNVRQPR